MNQNETNTNDQSSKETVRLYRCSPDIWIILAAISQLERDLIADRVKIGLANAKAKGKLIGRKKMRDSDLIRKLLKAGMSYRNISVVAKCSHGSVSAERAAMKREEEELKRKLAEQAAAEKQLQASGVVFPELRAPAGSAS